MTQENQPATIPPEKRKPILDKRARINKFLLNQLGSTQLPAYLSGIIFDSVKFEQQTVGDDRANLAETLALARNMSRFYVSFFDDSVLSDPSPKETIGFNEYNPLESFLTFIAAESLRQTRVPVDTYLYDDPMVQITVLQYIREIGEIEDYDIVVREFKEIDQELRRRFGMN